jgi:hypothetical protein
MYLHQLVLALFVVQIAALPFKILQRGTSKPTYQFAKCVLHAILTNAIQMLLQLLSLQMKLRFGAIGFTREKQDHKKEARKEIRRSSLSQT